ncbi:MAG: hypothetical protein E6G10_28180 [Actinobacteria bacterium]|nr:MAG: hypothetical protein E6G10_28180 [Actinomycetota bacterium]
MATVTTETPDLQDGIRAIGLELSQRLLSSRPLSAAGVERRLTGAIMSDAQLRAALFRFVDVRPACRTPDELVRHLHELLEAAEGSPAARRLARAVGGASVRRPVAAAAGWGIGHMARRFIAGEDAAGALREIERLWRAGAATTIDLLGEATVTEDEADRYAARCEDTLRTLAAAAAHWPARPALERDSHGELPRVNLSVKVSALTPELRALAPERGIDGARPRLRRLLRIARDCGAHLHVDMESLDTRDATTRLLLQLLEEPEFAAGPSAGLVVQAYLVESPAHVDAILEWAARTRRAVPFTVRLVKGAYWDHELVEATQHGWPAPVFTDRRDCDRNYEALTRRLIDAASLVRPAIASHNVRSIAQACAYADAVGLPRHDLELQVLRGLGDDLQAAIAATGRRVRTYCPIGDLVAGMAYLVRRLLENTANDSFLAARACGADIATLLEAP